MNSSQETLSPQSRDYLAAVRSKLADLPAADQSDLLEQVEQRLRDLDASAEYRGMAADLRAAAGFPAAAVPAQASPFAGTSADLFRSVARSRAARPGIDYVLSLRPAWWAIRGYILLAGILAAISQGGGYGLHTLGSYRQAFTGASPVHTSLPWLLIPASAVVASVVLGLLTSRFRPPVRLLVTAANIVTVALLVAYPTWWLAPAFAHYAGLWTS